MRQSKGLLKQGSIINALLKKIKIVAMDIDGVLTAGEIIVLDSGDLKIWNVKDRLAFALLKNVGSPFKIIWVTGRSSMDVKKRAKEIGVERLFENCADKKEAYNKIVSEFGVSSDQIAYIGDDLIDIPILKRVGVAACPCDAPNEVKEICDIVLDSAGGRGVFREFAELLLKSNGLWNAALERYTDA